MSELQNDFDEPTLDENELTEAVESENHEDGADLATASESEHEEQPKESVEDEAAKQEAIQKAINKKHFEAQQAKRELEAANKRIEEFEAKQREQMEAQIGNIPPLPDPFDDDYEEKVRQREELIAKKAQYDAQQSVWQQQQQAQQQQAEKLKQEQLQAQVQAYNARTKELGISPDELQAAGNTVAQYGISDDLTMAILADSDGPLITKYLAANPMELSSLSNMNPLQGAMHIERVVRAKANALKPKPSNAPKPSENLQGRGQQPGDGKYKNIKGAKFE
jgi:hypothetical protein